MSDSEDEGDGGGMNLAGFLFGNIDPKTGQLEESILDADSMKQLSALQKLGLGGMMSVVTEGDEEETTKPATRIISSCYSDSESEDEENFDESSVASSSEKNKEDLKSMLKMKTEDEEEDYDEEIKSPSAIDFSDINELADEDSPLEENLMPPPPVPIPIKAEDDKKPKVEKDKVSDITSPDKKLETPLAAMLPSKYAGVDVTDIFPDFRTGKVLRFARLFGPGKQSSLPQVWKNVRKRRRKRKANSESGDLDDNDTNNDWTSSNSFTVNPAALVKDEQDLLVEPLEKNTSDINDEMRQRPKDGRAGNVCMWRQGPAQLWFDMLGVPEDDENFDYGFTKPTERNVDEADSDSAESEGWETAGEDESIEKMTENQSYHMATQVHWETEIVWDGNDGKYKKLTKSKAVGWVPSGINRTVQNFGQPGGKSSGNQSAGSSKGGGGSSSSGAGSSYGAIIPSSSGTQKQKGSKSEELNVANADDPWHSIFPVETSELVHYKWEDDVIWDCDAVVEAPQPRVLALDPNDENVILCIPDDVDPNASANALAPVKIKIPHPHVKKSKILLGKAGVINVIEEDSPPPSPKNDDKDPYNISNDEFYQSKYTEQSLIKISSGGNIIQHSTPVVELRAPFIPTHMSQTKLRSFHRPALRRFQNGPLSISSPHYVLPLTRHIAKKAKQREHERLAAGGGDIFFMRTPEDLSGKDGELFLVEYCEEHPPLLAQVGMCSKVKNYYKRKAGKDTGPPECRLGETAYAHTSPFLGAMHPGQLIPTIENNMYRTPIYEHPTPASNFIIIRTRTNYFIREYESLYSAGQQCPLYEVPGPNSKRANNFVRDFLQVFIYRLFWKSRDNPRRIRMEEIKRSFPMHSESSIRKRLKLCADFKRTGVDSNWWVIKPEFRLPTEEEIRAMVSPEQCCAYFSLTSAEQRLKDAGYGEKFLFAPEADDDDDNQGKIDDEVKTAPWNTTRAYILAMRNKCLLQLSGPADPTGCGEGFSYIRVPNKPQTNKEEQEAAQPRRIVTGTDADLRRLSLNNAKALLRKFGVPEDEIKKLSRWEVIDVVRTLSTEKAKAGEKGMTKFSRGNRFSVAEHQERYKEECQRIFELQNRVLTNSELLSTDEAESSEEDDGSDMEEYGKNIENMLNSQKTSSQLTHEKEEQERRELQKMIMGEGKDDKDDDKSPKKGASKMGRREMDDYSNSLSGLINHPGRVLKIHRTFTSADGKEYTRTEIVRKSAIIDIYMRIRTTKEESWIRQFALLDDQAKEEMKKEKRRLQEQLRRIKRNQEKETHKTPVVRKKKVKVKPDLKMKCGACGQVGHMRTNKACPLYQNTAASLPSMNVAMTEEQEEEIEKQLILEDEELVKVEGTKVQLSGKLFKHAEEIKRRSLMLKVPKEVMEPVRIKKKKRVVVAPHCDYLSKKKSKVNRQRIDPKVVIAGIFEGVLKELVLVPDSSHFHLPVSSKIPNYHHMIRNPMDLQTMREQVRQHKYQTRSDFLNDVQLIMDNCAQYNGAKHILTVYAERIVDTAKQLIQDKEDKLQKLERMINPLLDDDDQTGLSYILENATNKLKTMQQAFPFLKPVNKKKVKDYYDIIEFPMDLETIMMKVKGNQYHSRSEYMADIELLYSNSVKYNGADNVFTEKAKAVVESARAFLEQFTEYLAGLEKNIVATRAMAEALDDEFSNLTGIEDVNTPPSVNIEETYDFDSSSRPPHEVRGDDDDDVGDDEEEEDDEDEEDEEEDKGGYSVAEDEGDTMNANFEESLEASSDFDPDISAPRMKRMRTDSQKSTPGEAEKASAADALMSLGLPVAVPMSSEHPSPENPSMDTQDPGIRQNLHADLEVSDSDAEEDDDSNSNNAKDDDGLWF